jgi:DNA replication protein DnaC
VIPERFREAELESCRPCNPQQERALPLMKDFPEKSWNLAGSFGSGKAHLYYAQYRRLAIAGGILCHARTTRELVEELRNAELESGFVSPVIKAACDRAPYHLFWDDIDKLKVTEFKTEVLFELVDALYVRKHGLTVTANYSLRDLVESGWLHPAIVRRLDDMCRVIEL